MLSTGKHTTIATIRHGETNYNLERRYAGAIDISLNNNGRNDALTAASRLSEVMEFDFIISSQLKRAFETACFFTDKPKEIIRTGLCNERNYGQFEGVLEKDIKTLFPDVQYWEAGDDKHSLDPPNGEPFEDLHRRAQLFRQFVFNQFEGLNILVVSHATFLQQFHGVLRGHDWTKALERCVKNIECNLWHFRGPELIREKTANLIEREQNSW